MKPDFKRKNRYRCRRTCNKQQAFALEKAAVSVLLWIVLWQLAALWIDNELFLPSPLRVGEVLFIELLPTATFRSSLLHSMGHILAGFFLGGAAGIFLAVLAFAAKGLRLLFWFPIRVLQSVPVASFVILALLWLDAEGLAIFIPAVVVLPIWYQNTLTGLLQTEASLLDMAELFRISPGRRIRYIYFPQVLPYVLSAASLAMGMAWKSGVAAEIIGLIKYSIGNELYKAKLYLMTPTLFAWTVVIVLLSILCESLLKWVVRNYEY